MVCARQGTWPFSQGPEDATLAQYNLLAAAIAELTPSSKPKKDMVDKHTMQQWHEMHEAQKRQVKSNE